jgi:hypothetical protein
MNSVGQSGDGKSYRVILLLVVGLAAFSSAMKELNVLREFTRDTNTLVASWSNAVTPERVPVPHVVVPTEISQPAVEVEVCESSETLNSAEPVERLLGGSVARDQARIKDGGKTVVAERSGRRDAHVAALRSHRSADIDLVELRKQIHREANLKVTIMADSDGEAKITIPSGFEFKLPKVKTFQPIIVKPEEREILKSLNRGFNLRSAG